MFTVIYAWVSFEWCIKWLLLYVYITDASTDFLIGFELFVDFMLIDINSKDFDKVIKNSFR